MNSVTRAALVALTVLSLAALSCKKDEPKPGAPVPPPGPGDKIASGASQMGDGIAQGAKQAWDKTKEGAVYVGDKVSEGAKYVGDRVATGAKLVAAGAGDSWITTKIKGKVGITRLFAVSVDTVAGVVTLTGRVKTAPERAEIEALAKGTDGVKAVVNKIVVDAATPTPPPAPAVPAPPPTK